jgi:hypothetical protein
MGNQVIKEKTEEDIFESYVENTDMNATEDDYLDVNVDSTTGTTDYTLHLVNTEEPTILFKPITRIICGECQQERGLYQFPRNVTDMYKEINDKSLWIATASPYTYSQEWYNQQYEKAFNLFVSSKCCDCLADFYDKIQRQAIEEGVCPSELDKEYNGGCGSTCPCTRISDDEDDPDNEWESTSNTDSEDKYISDDNIYTYKDIMTMSNDIDIAAISIQTFWKTYKNTTVKIDKPQVVNLTQNSYIPLNILKKRIIHKMETSSRNQAARQIITWWRQISDRHAKQQKYIEIDAANKLIRLCRHLRVTIQLQAANKLINWWRQVLNTNKKHLAAYKLFMWWKRVVIPNRWKYKLRTNDQIDCYDSEVHIWREAYVMQNCSLDYRPRTVIIHFVGWDKKWDIILPIGSSRISQKYTKTKPWRELLKIGDYIEYKRYSDYNQRMLWFKGKITNKKQQTDSCNIYIEDLVEPNRKYWKQTISESITQKGTHIKKWDIPKYCSFDKTPTKERAKLRANHYVIETFKNKQEILTTKSYNNDHMSGMLWTSEVATMHKFVEPTEHEYKIYSHYRDTQSYTLLQNYLKKHILRYNYEKEDRKQKYDLIQKRISVRWKQKIPKINKFIPQWYNGYITSYNEIDNTYCIMYDDGQQTNTNLDNTEYNIISPITSYAMSENENDEEKIYISLDEYKQKITGLETRLKLCETVISNTKQDASKNIKINKTESYDIQQYSCIGCKRKYTNKYALNDNHYCYVCNMQCNTHNNKPTKKTDNPSLLENTASSKKLPYIRFSSKL